MFNIFASAPWAKAPRKDYDIEAVTNGVVRDLEDIWPEVPSKFRVHRGDLVVDGPASFGTPDEGDSNLYVIAGNLTVKGPLRVRQFDTYGILYVTGSVTCNDAFLEHDGSLIVGGALAVHRLLVTTLGDQGMLVVHGALAAQAWLEARGRGFIDFRELHCPNPLYSGKPEHYRAAGRGQEPGEVAYLFDVNTARDARTMLLPAFFKGDAVDAEALISAACRGADVLQS